MNADEWQEIRRLHDEGTPIKRIAVQLEMSRNTVRRALTLEEAPTDHRRRRGSSVDDVDSTIRELMAASPDIRVSEISERIGWTRSRTTLSRRVAQIRDDLAVSVDSCLDHDTQTATRIPSYATTFVGRRTELFELRRLLGSHRLVTISGPGGMGKTRLALRAAQEFHRAFEDGVRVVELGALGSPELLTQTVADALAIGHRDSHGASTDELLIEHLRTRHTLLVLDNCEHLLDACAQLTSQLMRTTTHLRVIATSREVLGIPEEFAFALSSLPTSTPCGDTDTAVELFVSRANSVLSGFSLTDDNRDAVVRVCERLDGLPLAIELACARLPVLSVQELATRLDHRLDLLTLGNRTAPQRHRSLQATMDWSYDLCTAEQRLLWARLSVFAGGFDLDMAEEVCSDDDAVPRAAVLDAISALVGKSVLHREDCGDGRVRFRMLESIREYGLSRLARAELTRLQERHLRWCASLVSRTTADWFSADQTGNCARIRANHANIRSALQIALDDATADDPRLDTAAALLSSSRFLWACGISIREHRMWLERVLEFDRVAPVERGRTLTVLGLVQTLQGDRESADEALREAQVLARSGSDEVTAAFAENGMGLMDYFAGEFTTAEAQLLRALAAYEGVPGVTDLACMVRIHLGMLYCFTGNTAEAEELFTTVLRLSENAGETWLRSYAVYGRGLVALTAGDHASALELGSESLSLRSGFDDQVGTTLVTDLLAWAEAEVGTAERSAVLLGAASAMWSAFGQQLYGSVQWVDKRAEFERKARAALGDEAYEKYRRRGADMSVAELIRFARGETAPTPTIDDTDVPTPELTLSPREQEVARHLAAGMTNKEIAAKLVLSTRTVEGHVERTLRKLGVGRRSEVATALAHAGRTSPGRVRV
ncbi:ATP-binding protein [Rhodococcus sp. NPDC003318]|uniref:ATP-binding protein n=1 Tax=Rhodococcus sp. NPDC003318 TaxID=3364503 RepID=UPI00368EA935